MAMYGIRDYSFKFSWTRPEITFIRRLRQAEFARRLKHAHPILALVYVVARVRYQRLCMRYGATLPLDVFGPGLTLAHIGGVTINADALVGSNCRLHPGVTVGSVGDRAPVIGNDVFLGPNAVVVGGITIGDRTHIGPGAVVSDSVQADRIVTVGAVLSRERIRPTWQQRQMELTGISPER